MGNTTYTDNTLIADVVEALANRLPEGWRLTTGRPTGRSNAAPEVDAVLKFRRPESSTGSVLVEARTRLEPRDVDYLAATLRPTSDEPVLIVARFLSPRTQQRLRDSGFAYADLTGNVRLSLSEPGLFIETSGASRNPEPDVRDRKSLKGAKAGRLVRALCDFRPPVGLRELAKRAGVDPGYASRVVAFLTREALVARTARGPITSVDWSALLRRWSEDYTPFDRRRVAMYFAARGISPVTEMLKNVSVRFAVSGSWASAQFAPVAPPRLLLIFVETPTTLADALDLRLTDSTANVALARPFDPVVYERTVEKKGITVAAPSQVVADLLTSPGRGPNEAKAFIEWMQGNEDAWRV